MTKRALMPDYLRLIALFGIVVVNVQYIGFSALDAFTDQIGSTLADKITLMLVNGLALLKTYGLFSFMFGVGLGFLIRSAERKGQAFSRLYKRRLIGLFLMGLLHGCLFFPGDILTIYALTGGLLYLFRNWELRRLVRVGAVLLIVQIIISLPLFLAPATDMEEFIQIERDIFTDGLLIEAVAFRSIGFLLSMPILLVAQGLSALGWFCLGYAAVKSGMIDTPEHPLWARARRLCLGPGLALSLTGAALWQWGSPVLGAVIVIIAAPLATLGYLGLIAAIARPRGKLVTAALAAGGSSLSIYLGQSIILSTLFAPYGADLWSKLTRLEATLVALLVTALLITALSLWKRRFALGPFEWVLRKITYAGQSRA